MIRPTLLLSFLLVAISAQAGGLLPHKILPNELDGLPPICQAKFGKPGTNYAPWKRRIGREGDLHLGHFCQGINFLNRAMATTDKAKKRIYLERSIGHSRYSLINWPKQFPLRRQAQLNIQQAEMMLKFLK